MIFARYMPVIGLWLGLICAVALPVQGKKERKSFQVPDIFVLGDSQFAFGAGPAFHKFVSDRQSPSVCPDPIVQSFADG